MTSHRFGRVKQSTWNNSYAGVQAHLQALEVKPAQITTEIDRLDTSEYRKDYNAGWRYSHSETATLDHGDAINASDAWYDGYLDYSTSREKWHYLHCPAHHNGPGGCGKS